MSGRAKVAMACVVSIAAHLSLGVTSDENEAVWLDVLRDVLPDCGRVGGLFSSLWVAANDLVEAESAPYSQRSRAKDRLRYELRAYYLRVSADRFEAWQKAGGVSRGA